MMHGPINIRVTYVCGATHFSQSASTLNSGDTEFWQRVIKERQENFIHAIFPPMVDH